SVPPVVGGLRLAVDKGELARLPEDGRGELPAGVAVDAGRVHEEVAGDVFGDGFVGVGHCCEQPTESNWMGAPQGRPSVAQGGAQRTPGGTVTPPPAPSPERATECVAPLGLAGVV